jgi:hypothetical protein
MANKTLCANCVRNHDEVDDICVLSVLVGVSLQSRQSITDEQAIDIIKNTNADMLWDDIGPIIDRLEEGYYRNVDE